MTSQWATTWVDADLDVPRFARVDREGVPIQLQIPVSSTVVTATGAVPTPCPELVILNAAAPITLTAASLANLVGRKVTFASDAVHAVAHVIALPANSIGGGNHLATFDADADASVTFHFFRLGASFYASVVSLNHVTIS